MRPSFLPFEKDFWLGLIIIIFFLIGGLVGFVIALNLF